MKYILAILTTLSLGTANAVKFEGSIPAWKKDKETFKKSEETFKKALQNLKDHYVDKSVTEDDLYRAATEGMIAALNSGEESWNTLLNPRAVEDMDIDISGELVGIGTTLDFDDSTGNAKIRSIIPNSAAEKSGLQKNDLILNVNGKRYSKLIDMVSVIRGKAGEIVRLKILRGDRIIEMKITRDVVKLPFVISTMINAKTGYLSIQHFKKNSAQDLKKVLDLFASQKIEKLILDLRGSPGGLFDQGIEVADLFLEKGQVIVKTQSRDGSIKEYKATGKAWSPQTKIVIIIDPDTASSAEILTAALKENRKAILVGTTTAGKGTIESLEELPNGYKMKYSVRRLLSPTGKSYEGEGLTPDYKISEEKMDFFPFDFIKELPKRIEKDNSLKLAVELPLS